MLIPCFVKLNCAEYTKSIIIKGLITAIFFSSFIYLEYLGIEAKLLNTIFISTAYVLLVTIHKKAMFIAGFFIGIFWFWWVANSFIYYDLAYLMPLIILVFAMGYGLFFYATALINNIFIRIILLYSLSFFEPFGFNWLKIDLPLINTYYNFYESKIKNPDLKIYLPQYNTNQNDKWNTNNLNNIVNEHFHNIDFAIKNNYDLIVLPETTFPLVLNTNSNLILNLKEKSKEISIIAGSLSLKNKQYLNSSYLFQNGKISIANKVVLVPFGEAIPLPKFLRDFINDIFFNGAQDYQKAKEATDFTINDIEFRNAICWEATTDEIYKNLKSNYVIALSNNAWFTPSIEPVLQSLLLKYYAKKYDLMIYHTSNKSQNKIITGSSIRDYN